MFRFITTDENIPMSRRFVLFTLLIVAGLCLFSCSTKQKEQPKKRIAGIVFQEDQFFRLVLFGMRDAAQKNGVELLEANSANKPDKEVQLINTYIANNVDAIAIAPLSAKSSVSALERAREKGITVITHNMTLESDLAASSIESDQFDIGASTGKARELTSRASSGEKQGSPSSPFCLSCRNRVP